MREERCWMGCCGVGLVLFLICVRKRRRGKERRVKVML